MSKTINVEYKANIKGLNSKLKKVNIAVAKTKEAISELNAEWAKFESSGITVKS